MLALAGVLAAGASAQSPARRGAAGAFFRTPLQPAEMAGKQAVVETTAGEFVIELLPERAPNHVGYFIKLVREGAYEGTTFHRVIKYGIIQGGDPFSRDPAARRRYGTGGLGVLRAEPSDEPMTAGAVAGVLQPGNQDSAGSQFFVLVTDQPALQGRYTVFGRVVDGLEVVQAISAIPADAEGRAAERVEIRSVTIRDAPPPAPVPFTAETVEELEGYRAVLETTWGRSCSGSIRARRRSTSATSCASRRWARTTARASTASCPASSCREACSTPAPSRCRSASGSTCA